jgi:hypothetical protein
MAAAATETIEVVDQAERNIDSEVLDIVGRHEEEVETNEGSSKTQVNLQ